MRHWRTSRAALLALLLGISGCELAGEVAPPAKTELRVKVAAKQLRFTWDPADGATSYRLLEDPDGLGFMPLGADLAATSYDLGIAVYRHDWSLARYKVQACNDLGCTDSNELGTSGGMLTAIGYLKAWNAGLHHHFGAAVAVSAGGDTLAVGAPGEASSVPGVNPEQSNELAPDSGAVYVYARGSTGWGLQARVKASDAIAGAAFGWSLALSADGSALAVGAPYAESGRGAAYLFSRGENGWEEQGRFAAPDASGGDHLAWSVSLSGDGSALVAGAPDAASGVGVAHVFVRGESGWSDQSLSAPAPHPGDQFGWAVTVSGDGSALAVGAPGAGSSTGAVDCFARSETGYVVHASMEGSSAEPSGRFGHALSSSADGQSLAVSAPYAGAPGATLAGAVYLFSHGEDDWALSLRANAPNAGTGDRFGAAVSLSADGSTLAVGADEEDGSAVGVGGDPGDGDDSALDSGSAYLFTRVQESWYRQAYVKAGNTGAGDAFGYAVSLSGSGDTLAVGATRESGAAVTGDGERVHDDSLEEAGAVYLY
jgi:hypothetical protein